MTYLQLLQTTLGQGVPMGRALQVLRAQGASPVEAAMVVQAVVGISYQAAQRVVADSRAWNGPRTGALSTVKGRIGAIGQHGLSGHGASSVLPHLVRQSLAQVGNAPGRHRA